jgi:hypothetical protein
MRSISIIPGVLVVPVREGVYAASRDVAQAIDHGEGLRACSERLAGVCRLLDVIKWTEYEPAGEVEVDLGVHLAALRAAVEIMLPLLRDSDRSGDRGLYEALSDFATANLPDVPRRMVLPGEVVRLLRSLAYVEVVMASEEFDPKCELHASGYVTGPLARFDLARALLDAVGWEHPEHQERMEVDFAVYGRTIVDLLERDLDFQRSITDARDYTASEREDAAKTAALIEGFIAELDGGHS